MAHKQLLEKTTSFYQGNLKARHKESRKRFQLELQAQKRAIKWFFDQCPITYVEDDYNHLDFFSSAIIIDGVVGLCVDFDLYFRSGSCFFDIRPIEMSGDLGNGAGASKRYNFDIQ